MLQDKQKKKSPMRGACVVGLALTLLMSSAGAYTVKSVTGEDLFTEEVLQQWEASPWAQSEVNKAQMAGLLTAHTSGDFKANITRFQFAELVSNMMVLVSGAEIAPAADTTFPDTKEPAVLQAAAAGVVKGLDDGTFGGDKLITRQEICVMLERANDYLQTKGAKYLTYAKDINTDEIADWNEVADWATKSVRTVIEWGVMNGTSDTTVTPLGNTSVEQAIIMIYRLYMRY